MARYAKRKYDAVVTVVTASHPIADGCGLLAVSKSAARLAGVAPDSDPHIRL